MLPVVLLAQITADTNTDTPVNQSVDIMGNLINQITYLIYYFGGWILTFVYGIIVLMLIIGGIQYIMNDKDGGKKTITAAIIGLVIIMLSHFIVYALFYGAGGLSNLANLTNS